MAIAAAVRDGLLTVPVIDISSFRMPYVDVDARESVARQVDEAARTVGFMQITGHGIQRVTLDGFTAAMDAFFALDPETKAKYCCPPGINRGYTPPKAQVLASGAGLFEELSIVETARDYPDQENLSRDVCAPDVFPAEVPGFEEAVELWISAAGRVARTMVKIFGAALGDDPRFFESLTGHYVNVLRMDNYVLPGPGMRLEEDQPSMGAHTDYGIVTVLWADHVPGLEILGADDGWHPVRPAAGALLVNLGDTLARWTNDKWISAMHRVAPPRVNGALVPRRSAELEALARLPGLSPARPA
jgi:isopenicillin N synthase-like dioxygenase